MLKNPEGTDAQINEIPLCKKNVFPDISCNWDAILTQEFKNDSESDRKMAIILKVLNRILRYIWGVPQWNIVLLTR